MASPTLALTNTQHDSTENPLALAHVLLTAAVRTRTREGIRSSGRASSKERNAPMKSRLPLCRSAALLSVLAFGGSTAQAATCTVPGTHATIQAAVNDSSCSIINVAPGPYSENVTINRSLVLNGAQMGVPVAGRLSGGPLESTVYGANPIGANPVISINASNVVINGFTLRNPVTTGAAIGIAVNAAGSAALITYNIIDTITTLDTGANGTAQAVYLQNGPDNVNIVANEMKNVQSARSAKGVLVGDNGAGNAAVNTVIQGNSISNITSNNRGSYGISVANATVPVSGLKIRDNTISTLTAAPTGWIHAIGLEGNTPGVIVEGNSISNFITVSPDAIAVWFESNPSFPTGQVHQNNFDLTIADYGIAVQPVVVGVVDGTCNWWGDPNGPGPVGPGAGAMVSANVDYTPWLNARAPGAACVGGLASTPGKVTGGGQIPGDDPLFSPTGDLLSIPALTASASSGNGKATFGFVVKCCAPSGNLEYNDQAADVRIKAQSIDGLFISSPGVSCPAVPGSKHATFTGTAQVIRSGGTTTESFTVEVDDCGEPGTADTFGIRTTTYSNGPSTLIGGNIQIH